MLNIDDRLIKEISPKIKPNALSVLLAIAIHLSKKNGTCFPSHERLMMLTGMGRDAVYVALKVLKDNELLIVNQVIDSKNKKFGQRTFRVSTKFIKIFIDADEAEPLTENPYTVEPEAEKPYTESQETQRLNESSNGLTKKEQLNEGGREREAKKNTPTPADFDEMMERVNAETRDVEEKEKNKSPFIPGVSPNYEPSDFDIYSKVPLTDMLEDDPGLLVNGFDASTLPGAMIRTAEIMPTNGTQITIKTGMNEAGETYVFEHTERVTNPTPAARILNGVNRAPLAEDSDGAQKLIMAWATNGALETVQNWYNLARRKFTAEDLELITAKFCGTYSTIADAGRRSLFFSDPVQFFKNKGRVFIQDQKSFERMNEPKNGFAQPETKYTPPPASEKIPAYTP